MIWAGLKEFKVDKENTTIVEGAGKTRVLTAGLPR